MTLPRNQYLKTTSLHSTVYFSSICKQGLANFMRSTRQVSRQVVSCRDTFVVSRQMCRNTTNKPGDDKNPVASNGGSWFLLFLFRERETKLWGYLGIINCQRIRDFACGPLIPAHHMPSNTFLRVPTYKLKLLQDLEMLHKRPRAHFDK